LASNGNGVEEIWKNFKERVFEIINRFVPHKIMRKNPDFVSYNKAVKRIIVYVRRVYNTRKLGE